MSILEEKMDAQDMILDDITRKQLIRYGHVENGPNVTTINHDSLET
jgi:hypothetical protein